MKLLHLIASPRIKESRTLKISNEFIESLKKKNESFEMREIDLFKADLPEVYVDEVDAKYALLGGGELSPVAKASWEKIEKYAREFLEYDTYLISTPMWNFTVPYPLKKYIDVIMQPGLLFAYTAEGVKGLATGKKMYCVTTRGSDYSEASQMSAFDHLNPYHRSIFGLAGIYDISFVNAQPLDYSPDLANMKIDEALAEVRNI